MRKWAYMGVPHTGGTYSVFRNLREGLLKHGIKLHWIGVGAEHAKGLADGAFDGELQFGTVIAPEESEDKKQGAVLVEFFDKRNYEGVFMNAMCGRVATNFVRYLDTDFTRIMIVHTITVATYAAARAMRDYVHATVGVSPRIRADLIKHKGFDNEWTVSIPNAVQMEDFKVAKRPDSCGVLRVLSLGRVEDGAKGCFLLPKIISQVGNSGAGVQWQIAGDGPDLAELKRRCHNVSNVRFLGRIPYRQVSQVLSQADVYIFPSRYEGFGLSLVEAMASGCVPVASAIRGVVDGIIEHGKTGYLFPIGRWRKAAEHVIRLARDRARVKEMSVAATNSVCRRFSIETVTARYISLMEEVLGNPRPLKAAIDIQQWRYPGGLRAGLRTYLPEGIKSRLRVLRESIHRGTA